jgi:hypothetical protein
LIWLMIFFPFFADLVGYRSLDEDGDCSRVPC